MYKLFVTCLSFIAGLVISYAKVVNPTDYGILKAKSSIERFEILLKCHLDAIENNYELDYSGIDSLIIEIPSNARPIPLPKICNFHGLKLYVINKEKDIFLFERKNNLNPISILKEDFEGDNYKSYSELNKGLKILCIKDKKPWVNERQGYGYPFYRQDLLLLKDGIPVNSTIMSYSDSISDPVFSYCNAENSKTIISNLNFYRSEDSIHKTFCIQVSNINNIEIKNIHIVTPESGLFGDQALNFNNCTNLICRNILIEETYSLSNRYGYGISMNNVYNSTFYNITSHSSWGIFGNNNINTAHIINCDINRFDVHCYGKNIICKNTTFRDLYNQFSSISGSVVFENCSFINFIPVLLEDSYAAYSKFDVFLNNCVINGDPGRPYLIDLRKAIPSKNARNNFSTVFWPNVYLKDVNIKMCDANNFYSLYHSLAYMKKGSQIIFIKLNNVNISNDNKGFEICNLKIDPNNIKLTQSNLQGIFHLSDYTQK